MLNFTRHKWVLPAMWAAVLPLAGMAGPPIMRAMLPKIWPLVEPYFWQVLALAALPVGGFFGWALRGGYESSKAEPEPDASMVWLFDYLRLEAQHGEQFSSITDWREKVDRLAEDQISLGKLWVWGRYDTDEEHMGQNGEESYSPTGPMKRIVPGVDGVPPHFMLWGEMIIDRGISRGINLESNSSYWDSGFIDLRVNKQQARRIWPPGSRSLRRGLKKRLGALPSKNKPAVAGAVQ